MVEGLVQREGDPTLRFGVVYQEVKNELREGENCQTGDEPDTSGMDEGVGEQGVPPEPAGGTLGKEAGEIRIPVFRLREKSALETTWEVSSITGGGSLVEEFLEDALEFGI